MSHSDFIRSVSEHLDVAGIPYMVVGSVASSVHGEGRATYDVDLVIDPEIQALEAFVQAIGRQVYVSPEAAREALRLRSMFNVIDTTAGWKADLIVKSTRPFDRVEFERRRLERYADVPIYVATPEDVILSKLAWAKLCESERQIRDAAGVYFVQRGKLDREYLAKWAPELGVVDLLRQIEIAAEEL